MKLQEINALRLRLIRKHYSGVKSPMPPKLRTLISENTYRSADEPSQMVFDNLPEAVAITLKSEDKSVWLLLLEFLEYFLLNFFNGKKISFNIFNFKKNITVVKKAGELFKKIYNLIKQ